MARNLSKTTTDHDTIRRWVEERGGWPAEVEATAREGQTGILRIDFPGSSGEGRLGRIDWDTWFEKFDASGLALVYEDETSGGERSNFNKLVSRETAAARTRGGRTSRRSASRGRAAGARRPAGKRASAKRAGAGRARSGARTGARAGKRTGARAAKRSTGRRQASRSQAARTAGGRGGRGGGRRGGAGRGRGTARRSR